MLYGNVKKKVKKLKKFNNLKSANKKQKIT